MGSKAVTLLSINHDLLWHFNYKMLSVSSVGHKFDPNFRPVNHGLDETDKAMHELTPSEDEIFASKT